MAGKSRESRVRTLTYVAGNHSFSINGPIRPTANQVMSIFELSNVLDMLPVGLVERSQVRTIAILETECELNAEFAKKTNKKSFSSFATASATGEIKLYKNRDSNLLTNRQNTLVKMVCHELAHLFDHTAGRQYGRSYHGISLSQMWQDAVEADKQFHSNWVTSEWGKYVSKYAKSFDGNLEFAMAEDFADSIGAFFCLSADNRNMVANYPNRVSVIRRLFPRESETAIKKFAI